MRSFIKTAAVLTALSSPAAAQAPTPFKDASCSVTFYQLPPSEKEARSMVSAKVKELVGQTSGCRSVWDADVYFRQGSDTAPKVTFGRFDPRRPNFEIKFDAASLKKALEAK
jgi:hypothetical protein